MVMQNQYHTVVLNLKETSIKLGPLLRSFIEDSVWFIVLRFKVYCFSQFASNQIINGRQVE